jgi:hypothetical protein
VAFIGFVFPRERVSTFAVVESPGRIAETTKHHRLGAEHFSAEPLSLGVRLSRSSAVVLMPSPLRTPVAGSKEKWCICSYFNREKLLQ